MKASFHKYTLNFKRPGGTSRGVLTHKETWFIVLEAHGKQGVGECGLLKGLSIDDRPDYELKLQWVCENIHLGQKALCNALVAFPSIRFGVEMAFMSLASKESYVLFPSEFTSGSASISINGLIWMGDTSFMQQQIIEKMSEGFNCLKLKIGAIDFNSELRILKQIRQNPNTENIQIRVDANGAFSLKEASYKLAQLSEYKIHSIEQPIAVNQHDMMSVLCKTAQIPIALDEELIGIIGTDNKEALLQTIMPQYIILKPSLLGGFAQTDEWIALAEKYGIGWWITSALESNIGLNAIAQDTFLKQNILHQGLGTGSLYTNNFESPLEVDCGALWYRPENKWLVDL